MQLIYIVLRIVQVVLALVVLGISGVLHADITKEVSYTSLFSGLDLSSSSGGSYGGSSSDDYSSSSGSYDDLLSGITDDYSSSVEYENYLTDLTDMNNEAALAGAESMLTAAGRKFRRSLIPRAFLDLPKQEVASGMLLSAAVLSMLLAAANLAGFFLSFLANLRPILLKAALGVDIFLAILWIAAVGLSGNVLTKYKAWNTDYKRYVLFKAGFAMAFIMMLLFIGSAVLAGLLGFSKRTKEEGLEDEAAQPVYGQPMQSFTPAPEQQYQQQGHPPAQYH